jgi:SepF-like predicted cell division protein (DUF552 family)
MADDDYLELDTAKTAERRPQTTIRPFTVYEFQDVKEIIDAYRQGNTICILDVKRLKQQDMIELKRLINKLKKTVEAQRGDIAGFGDDQILVVPPHVRIHKGDEFNEVE